MIHAVLVWDFRAGANSPIPAPHFLQYRSLPPSATIRAPVRDAFEHFGQTSSTFEIWTGISLESRPPCGLR